MAQVLCPNLTNVRRDCTREKDCVHVRCEWQVTHKRDAITTCKRGRAGQREIEANGPHCFSLIVQLQLKQLCSLQINELVSRVVYLAPISLHRFHSACH